MTLGDVSARSALPTISSNPPPVACALRPRVPPFLLPRRRPPRAVPPPPSRACARPPRRWRVSSPRGPGLEARLRRGLPAASLRALPPPPARGAPRRTYSSLGFEGRSQAQAGMEPCKGLRQLLLRALSVVVGAATPALPPFRPRPRSVRISPEAMGLHLSEGLT